MDTSASRLLSSLNEEQAIFLQRELTRLKEGSLDARLDVVLQHQRQHFAAGRLVRVEAYVAAWPPLATDAEMLLHLITAEVMLRREQGESVSVTEYAARFPQHAQALIRQFEVEAAVESMPDSFGIPTWPVGFPPPLASAGVASPPGFEILGELGRGGMGVVFKARQVGLNRLVALKMILPGREFKAPYRERFLREAEVVARLNHPNIVPVYAFGDHAGQMYFAMAYLRGGPLMPAAGRDGEQQRTRVWPVDGAASLVATLANAVQYAHERGIIHRDLKPANVLLDEDGKPYLADFGLSRHLSGELLTSEGVVVGTPAYMAPEQALGQGDLLGPLVDIYGLGAILYQLLTGRPPRDPAGPNFPNRQALTSRPHPVKQLNADVPQGLRKIAEKALDPDPSRRHQSAAQLERELRHFLTRRRRRVLRSIAATGVLLPGLAGLVWLLRPEPVVVPSVHKPAVSKPLTGSLEIRILKPKRRGMSRFLVGEPGSTPGRPGDVVQIEVKLSRPAYIYLLWVDNEKAQGVYPWHHDRQETIFEPPPAQQPTSQLLTPEDATTAWPLAGPSGIETALLLARSTPLPDSVNLGKLLPRLPRVPLGDNKKEVMVRGIHEGRYQHHLDQNRGIRGLGTSAVTVIEKPLESLMISAKEHFEVIQAVRFAFDAADENKGNQ